MLALCSFRKHIFQDVPLLVLAVAVCLCASQQIVHDAVDLDVEVAQPLFMYVVALCAQSLFVRVDRIDAVILRCRRCGERPAGQTPHALAAVTRIVHRAHNIFRRIVPVRLLERLSAVFCVRVFSVVDTRLPEHPVQPRSHPLLHGLFCVAPASAWRDHAVHFRRRGLFVDLVAARTVLLDIRLGVSDKFFNAPVFQPVFLHGDELVPVLRSPLKQPRVPLCPVVHDDLARSVQCAFVEPAARLHLHVKPCHFLHAHAVDILAQHVVAQAVELLFLVDGFERFALAL